MASFTYASLFCALLVPIAFTCSAAPASDDARDEATGQPATTASNAPYRMSTDLRRNIAASPSWTAPQKPFRIYGNTWFVGPRGLGVFLIASPAGHILIDGGVPGDAALIEANLRHSAYACTTSSGYSTRTRTPTMQATWPDWPPIRVHR